MPLFLYSLTYGRLLAPSHPSVFLPTRRGTIRCLSSECFNPSKTLKYPDKSPSGRVGCLVNFLDASFLRDKSLRFRKSEILAHWIWRHAPQILEESIQVLIVRLLINVQVKSSMKTRKKRDHSLSSFYVSITRPRSGLPVTTVLVEQHLLKGFMEDQEGKNRRNSTNAS